MNPQVDIQDGFRDKISTVDQSGKRVWIFPKKPFGDWYNKRQVLGYILLAFLFIGPFLKVNGRPLLLLNILERKFVILGQIFWPQDLHIFALGMIVMVVFVTLFTVVFGRLFCGWVCPQTIFMELVFRRIEYWIEGDWKAQKKLKSAAWNGDKLLKKGLKQSIFWIISFLIANIFLAYIIGYEALFDIIIDDPRKHIGGLVAILIFSTIFYLVFSKMREQVCTVVCPYGRLQGVLLDKHSLNVIYDDVRGEDRAKYRKGEDRAALGKGDCIDCGQCVQVCPTGIDIRDGIQLECVNCTACIDACNFVMDKTGGERGLIRFDSTCGVQNQTPFQLTKRARAYLFVLIGLMGLMSVLLFTRQDVEATILRTRGTLFQDLGDGQYSNIYDLSIVNKTFEDIPLELQVLEGNAKLQLIGDPIQVQAESEFKGKFMLRISEEQFTSRQLDIRVGIFQDGQLIDQQITSFITPRL